MRDVSQFLPASRWLCAGALVALCGASTRAAQQPASASAADLPGQQTGAVSTPASQASPQGIASVPRPAPPAPLGPSGQLSQWFAVRGEFRGRLEGFSGGAFKPDNSDGYMLDRFRLNATITPSTAREVRGPVAGCPRVRQGDWRNDGPVPRHVGPAVGVRRIRRRAKHGTRRPSRARLRRAAPPRALELGERRAVLRRRPRHDRAQAVHVRRVRHFGRHDSARRVRQERRREQTLRLLRLINRGDPESHRRALRVLPAIGGADTRDRRAGRHPSDNDRHTCRRQASA